MSNTSMARVASQPQVTTTPNIDTINFFPHLPPYSDPKRGLVSKLPPKWIPYAQLMRIDRPGGFYAFYFPYLIGIMYSACIAPTPPNPATLLSLAAILLLLNILLRGAACTWNDNIDQDFDRRVERCRHRPIARGAVSTTSAHVFTAVQIAVGYPVLTFFPGPCELHMAIAVLLFAAYPFMKRITYYPQVFLGFPFAWALFFCVAALGMEPFGVHAASTLALFSANILWTIIYDTIYAHQDIADDEKAGVKGMALRFRNSTKLLASLLTICQAGLLALCGLWAGFGMVYFAGTVGGVAAAMAYYIYSVDLKKPESCGAWFHDQFWLVGAGFIAGLMGEYVSRLAG
ncbi:putative 4-hydroxybenzoate polyprenyl transferase [Hypomontagnella monticulosa]|nr:putative 4-hydroxybenzoate polyprenyl transferase [Hypomontagnella monticulosa]